MGKKIIKGATFVRQAKRMESFLKAIKGKEIRCPTCNSLIKTHKRRTKNKPKRV